MTLKITKCLRCGRNHAKLVFKPFKRGTPLEYKWWALCPRTKEPLMVGSIITEDPRMALLDAGGHRAEPVLAPLPCKSKLKWEKG
jgi:hypothetical protein